MDKFTQILGIILLLIFTTCNVGMSLINDYEYTVKITFCDNRPPIIIKYTGDIEPRIYNVDVGVPQWYKYYNVCNLEILNKKELK